MTIDNDFLLMLIDKARSANVKIEITMTPEETRIDVEPFALTNSTNVSVYKTAQYTGTYEDDVEEEDEP